MQGGRNLNSISTFTTLTVKACDGSMSRLLGPRDNVSTSSVEKEVFEMKLTEFNAQSDVSKFSDNNSPDIESKVRAIRVRSTQVGNEMRLTGIEFTDINKEVICSAEMV